MAAAGRTLFSLLLLVAILATGLAAQTAAGALRGRVVDSETLLPLEGAVVVLRATGPASEPSVSRYRSAVTNAEGEYHFPGLTIAPYRLQVRRVGYLAESIDVDLRPGDETGISLGLEPEPLLLPPVEVMGRDDEPFLRTEGGTRDAEMARVLVAQFRQRAYLSTDARELTHGEVVEAATLAETDVFRALQRIPGVSTRDDYTATLWTRGASWDQTRVYFDGLPLYNPTHAGWLFSAINPDAIGSVTFQPGVRSARWGEGAAAILDLRSRAGGTDKALSGRGELSLASARFALDGELFDRRFTWMVAARRTYVDVLTGVYGAITQDDDDVIPYDFSDVIARVDGDLGQGWGYTASGILERDRLRGDVSGLLAGNEGRWGNRSGQFTLAVPVGPFRSRLTAGRTDFRAAITDERDSTAVVGPEPRDPTLPAIESRIRHSLLALELGPASTSTLRGWSLGYQRIGDDVQYEGPVSLLSALAVLLPRRNAPGGIRSGTELSYHAFWGESRWSFRESLTLEAGLRVEVGDRVPNGGTTRPAPRLALRWQPSESTVFTTGWSTAYQYTQDIAPVAGPLGPQLHLSHLWVLAEPGRYSAMRARIATAGVEHWLDEGLLAGLNVYSRHTTGLALPNPTPERVTPDRDPDATAENVARGVELSLRRLTGRFTGSLGYAYGVSTIRRPVVTTIEKRDTILGSFPSATDVPHTLDATGMMRVTDRVRVGGGFTFGSGVPFTRLVLPDTTQVDREVLLGEPNAQRTPAYASLDLTADYTTTVGSWRITAYAQLRNALDRDNSVTYARSRECPVGGVTATRNAPPECRENFFEQGVPRLPLIGVRMSF